MAIARGADAHVQSMNEPEANVKAKVSYLGVARAAMREGDIVCFRGEGVTSWLIRWATRSKYSHIGLIHRFGARVYCLEAVGKGVRLVLMSHLMRRYEGGIDYFTVDAADEVRNTAIRWAFTQLGKLYDTAGIVRFTWTLLSGRARPVREDEQWFCSELVAAAFDKADLPLVTSDATYTSPSDIAQSERVSFEYALKP